MDWDIPRYWGADGKLHDSETDGPPDSDDLELGDSFLIHVVDENDIDRYAWVHGGIDFTDYDSIADAIADAIDALSRRGSL